MEPVPCNVQETHDADRRVDREAAGVDHPATELRLREAVHDVTRTREVVHEGHDPALAPLRHDEVVPAGDWLHHVREKPLVEAQVHLIEPIRVRRRGARRQQDQREETESGRSDALGPHRTV